jgi:signal peptidase I
VGDIVVFSPPSNWVASGGEPYIKRVIGVGGETVHIQDGSVFVDGTKLVEPYVFKEEDGQTQPTEPLTDRDTWVIPDGQLMLMGDHRGNSADSREFGPVDVSAVIGRAWLRYWPLNTFEVIPTPAHPELATAAP